MAPGVALNAVGIAVRGGPEDANTAAKPATEDFALDAMDSL